MTERQRVVVLAGGPDAEHRVSLASAGAIVEALAASPRYAARLAVIAAPDAARLAEIVADADVVFPAMHGRYGEGGTLQRLLETIGVPYVGAGPAAARLAIDKAGTKSVAAGLASASVDVPPTLIVDPADETPPLATPRVAKPNFEGSTIGLHLVRDAEEWPGVRDAIRASGVPYVAEPLVAGREITLGLVAGAAGRLEPLPIVEIASAGGLYDYAAKYERTDTRYRVDPELPAPVRAGVADFALSLAERLGIRHLARADFILRDAGTAAFLEINTMPGFTSHSLLPMAAAAQGVPMADLCAGLLDAALRGARLTPSEI